MTSSDSLKAHARSMNICMLGGSGFVGSHLACRLGMAGHRVTVLTRRRESAKHLALLPNVEIGECADYGDAALQQAFAGCDAVINLVGILHETRRVSFMQAHVDLPRRVATACRVQNVQRLLHMGALKADRHAPSAYLRSKAAGEEAVRQTAGDAVQVTIFRPSVIFGPGDNFLNMFARLARLSPALPLACPQARYRPVYVGDVARAFAGSLQNPATFGQAFDLCGPQTYTLRQLVQYVIDTCGLHSRIVGLNDTLSFVQAFAMEWLPGKLMTRDNYYSMRVDSVCDGPFPDVFGFQPTALESVAPGYLAGDTQRGTYLRYRRRAGR